MGVDNKCVIFDLDNCLSDDEWRIPHIAWHLPDLDARYAAYHSLSPFDDAHNIELVHSFHSNQCKIVLSTARPSTQRAATLEWFRRRTCLSPWALLMREPGDHSISAVLKERHLLRVLNWTQAAPKVLHAFDDRPDVIEMYHKHNVAATVLSIHDTCAYTKPDAQVEKK